MLHVVLYVMLLHMLWNLEDAVLRSMLRCEGQSKAAVFGECFMLHIRVRFGIHDKILSIIITSEAGCDVFSQWAD